MLRFITIPEYNNKGEKTGEKKHPVRVSYYVLKMLKEEAGKEVGDLASDDFGSYELMLYYALKRGYKMIELSMPFEKEDMEDIMDFVFFDFLALIPEFFPGLDEKKLMAMMPSMTAQEEKKK